MVEMVPLAGTNGPIDASTGVVAFIGIEVLLLGLTFVLMRFAKALYWDDWQKVRGRWGRVADLPDARPWRRVAVRGKASAGPDGVLRAPLSGELCVWWSVTTREHGPGAAVGERRECSESAFLVEDATGAVLLLPGEDGAAVFPGHDAHIASADSAWE